MITWGHLRRFVASVCGAVALAACQGSGEAAPSPLPVRPTEVGASPSAAAAPSVSASASTEADAWARVPKAARAHTFAGAQAFAEFYLTELNRAWSTADPEVIRSFSSDTCATCDGLVATADGMRRRSERYDGAAVSIVASTYLPESNLRRPVVRVLNVQQARAVVDQAGSIVRRVPKRSNEAQFELSWQEDHWLVDAIKDVQVSKK